MNTALNIIATILLITWGGVLMMSPMMIASRGMRDSQGGIVKVMLLLSYPVIVFVIIKVLGFGYFGMNAGTWLLVVSVIAALAIVVYGLPGMLLNIWRGIPNEGYFISASAVFLDGRRIKDADPRSFEQLRADSRYAKDGAAVYYYGRIVPGADPASFAPVKASGESTDNRNEERITTTFWKDEAHVYYDGAAIKGCDARTFQLIKGLYSCDAAHVYYMDKVVEKALPASFRLLSDGIATDDQGIFIYGKRTETPVDLESFTIVDKGDDRFCKDKSNVYLIFARQGDPLVKVEGADPDTFTTLERSYAKDKAHVYFYGNYQNKAQQLIRLDGADPSSFSIGYDETTGSEARDGIRYYMYGELVKQRR